MDMPYSGIYVLSIVFLLAISYMVMKKTMARIFRIKQTRLRKPEEIEAFLTACFTKGTREVETLSFLTLPHPSGPNPLPPDLHR